MDFLSFALDLIAAETGMSRTTLAPLERKIRHSQGGDRHYIASVAAIEQSERSTLVVTLSASGVSSAEIAERIGVTRRRVNQILAAQGSAAP